MSELMIDIETLGTSKNSVILSIGAVQFTDAGVEKSFYVRVDPESCTDWGLQIDARTVMWWFGQSEEARNEVASNNGKALDVALDELIAAFKWKDITSVWANGIDFDYGILEEALKVTGRVTPWPYWAKMDYRTVKNMMPRELYKQCSVENPVKHNALADATTQAATLVNMRKIIKYLTDAPANEPVATKRRERKRA